MAYKVVTVKDREYFSWMYESFPQMPESFPPTLEHIIVKYKPYEWVYPKLKGSKLFVFKKLADARKITRDIRREVIFQCRTKGLEKGAWCGECVIEQDIKDFWLHKLYYTLTPPGTYYADAVMITEKVERINT